MPPLSMLKHLVSAGSGWLCQHLPDHTLISAILQPQAVWVCTQLRVMVNSASLLTTMLFALGNLFGQNLGNHDAPWSGYYGVFLAVSPLTRLKSSWCTCDACVYSIPLKIISQFSCSTIQRQHMQQAASAGGSYCSWHLVIYPSREFMVQQSV